MRRRFSWMRQLPPSCVKCATSRRIARPRCTSKCEYRALFRARDHFGAEIGGDQVDRPALGRQLEVVQHHGDRIRLLPGGAGGAPDAQALARARGSCRSCGRTSSRNLLERRAVAKEGRFVRRHRLGHGARQRVAAVAQFVDERIDRAKAEAPHHGRKPALDQGRLVRRQHEARTAAHHLRQEGEVSGFIGAS